MTTRKEFDAAAALFEEAVSMYEAAKAEFDALQQAIHERLMKGELPPVVELNREELARVSLFKARERLARRAPLRPVIEPERS